MANLYICLRMNRFFRNRLLFFISGAIIASCIGISDPCISQKPFMIGGAGTWTKKGKPFAFKGAKITVFDSKCWDGYANGLNFSLVCSKIRGVYGFSFAPYSLCDKMCGFQIAFISKTTTLKGLEIGILNLRTGFVKPSVKSGNYGLQLGLMNSTFTNFGIQLGAINRCSSSNRGIAIGALNINSFLQIGFINIKKENNKGIQIGVFNFRKNNKWFAKVLPIMNFRIEQGESF